MANALVSSRLDYCNSLFRRLSNFKLHKLQCIQKSVARIVSNTSRYTSITPVLKKLHYFLLNIAQFLKTAKLVYKFLFLHISLLTSVLIVPGTVKVVVISLSFQSFTLNALPDEMCVAPSLTSFRKQLKTYLYTQTYPP